MAQKLQGLEPLGHKSQNSGENTDNTKTWFRRQTFHERNLIQIKADPNY